MDVAINQQAQSCPDCFGGNVTQTAWEEQPGDHVRSDSNNRINVACCQIGQITQ